MRPQPAHSTLLSATVFFCLILAISSHARVDLYDITSPANLTNSYATALNFHGQIAGYFIETNSIPAAFLFSSNQLATFFPETQSSIALAINDRGAIAGQVEFTDGTHPFIYDPANPNGNLVIPTIDGQATAINASGVIAGFRRTDSGFRAFVLNGNTPSTLGTLGGSNSFAYALDSAARVVGTSLLADNLSERAFFWDGASLRDLNDLMPGGGGGWVLKEARALNDLGAIAGSAMINGEEHAFLFSPEPILRDLGTLPGGTNSIAYGLNNSNLVVGAASAADGSRHAFVWENGAMRDLNGALPRGSSWLLREARAINDRGQIAGWGSLAQETRAFLLTPSTRRDQPRKDPDPARLQTQSIDEDGLLIIPLALEWPGLSGSNLTVQAFSSDQLLVANAGLTVSNRSNGIDLYLRPQPDAYGHTRISILSSDGQNTVTNTFLLKVSPVDDAPGFELSTNFLSVSRDGSLESISNFVTRLSAGPGNEQNQGLHLEVLPANSLFFLVPPRLDANGTLQFEAAPDVSGTAEFAVQLSDEAQPARRGTNFFQRNFSITINTLRGSPLAHWKFDSPGWQSEEGQMPERALHLSGASSWNGGGVRFDHPDHPLLTYPLNRATASNLTLAAGTVRFWFKADWDSVSQAGSGPVDPWPGLLTVQGTNGFWGLYLNGNGDEIWFDAGNNDLWSDSLSAPISWRSNAWHQIALTYASNAAILYLDGAAVATNAGVKAWPEADIFFLGADEFGPQSRGVIDELETFAYPLSPQHIQIDFALAQGLDRDQDLLPDLIEDQLGSNPLLPDNFLLTLWDGNLQTGFPTRPLAAPLMVRLTDRLGNPLPNAPIVFNGSLPGLRYAGATNEATAAPFETRTDSDGIASAWAILPPGGLSIHTTVATASIGTNLTNVQFESLSTDNLLISPEPGRYQTAQKLKVRCFVPGGAVHFTIDGREPATSDPVIAEEEEIPLFGRVRLKLRVWTNGIPASVVYERDYLINGSLATGSRHLLAIDPAGNLFSWGDNADGALGIEALSASPIPKQTPGLSNVVAVAAGWFHSLALDRNGNLWAWGKNNHGQVGTDRPSPVAAPLLVEEQGDIVAIAAGRGHSILLRSDGTVWTWGENGAGQLGDGTVTDNFRPQLVPGLTQVKAIAAGTDHSLALHADGTISAWGYNGDGELGNGTFGVYPSPVPVLNVTNAVAIAAGNNHSAALLADGTVVSWGGNWFGQLGDGTFMTRSFPVTSQASNVVALACGANHTIALAGNFIFAWGDNSYSQLGSTSHDFHQSSIGLSNATEIAAGRANSAIRTSAREIVTWGENLFGGPAGLTVRLPNPAGSTDSDTDGDGLPDWFETQWATALSESDTDHDGRTDLQELLDGTSPLNPADFKLVRLNHWGFDQEDWIEPEGPSPFVVSNVSHGAGWRFGALHVGANLPAAIAYFDPAPGGAPSLTYSVGTIRFWFKPDWSSASLGGNGPGETATLFQSGASVADHSAGYWGLLIDPDGGVVRFRTEGGGLQRDCLVSPITLLQGRWTEIALTYTTTNSTLYLNGTPAATGSGVEIVPDDATRQQFGFRIGSDSSGRSQARGSFDEWETFNFLLPEQVIFNDHQNIFFQAGGADADADLLPDWVELIFGTDSANWDSDQDGRGDRDEALFEQTNPLDDREALPARLAWWRFDHGDGDWNEPAAAAPLVVTNVLAPVGWSGRAVRIDPLARPLLVFPAVTTNGSPAIAWRNGTIRFWFQPGWVNDATASEAGMALLSFGDHTDDSSAGYWGLSLNARGDALKFSGEVNGTESIYASTSVSWCSNEWSQIAITYSPSNTAIFHNGRLLIETNSGVSTWPGLALFKEGFSIGTDRSGGRPVAGTFDNLETFNYPLEAAAISNGYFGTLRVENVALDLPRYTRTNDLRVEISGIPRASLAVLINPSNTASAAWSTLNANPNLGASLRLPGSDGTYDVWFGFDFNGTITWIKKTIVVDTSPPVIDPPDGAAVTSSPLLQIIGSSSEALSTIEFQSTSAFQTNETRPGFVISRQFDPATFRQSATTFQCFDLLLDPGENRISLQATDLAGNTTTRHYTYILDLGADQTPPAVAIDWPQDGARVVGETFTLAGRVDDPATVLQGAITDGALTNQFVAAIERDGRFWIEKIPMLGPTNFLTLLARDAAGNESLTRLTLFRSALALEVDPLDPALLTGKKVSLSGWINVPGYRVSVNDVPASEPMLAGDRYRWTVADLPLADRGVAAFRVRTTGSGARLGPRPIHPNPADPEPPAADTHETLVAVDRPLYVRASSYFEDLHGESNQDAHTTTAGDPQLMDYFVHSRSRSWTYANGGSATAFWTTSPGYTYDHPNGYGYEILTSRFDWPAGGLPPEVENEQIDGFIDLFGLGYHRFIDRVHMIPSEHCDVAMRANDGLNFEIGGFEFGSYYRRAHTALELVAGGKQLVQQTRLVQLTATAQEFTSPLQIPQGNLYSNVRNLFDTEEEFIGTTPLPPESVTLNGQTLAPLAVGAYSGAAYIQIPAGATVALSPEVKTTRHDFYTFQVGASEVSLLLAVDNNRDGQITFGESDRTSPARPYSFWVNDDHDEHDSGEPTSGSARDADDDLIRSRRDLEDFSRLWLLVKGLSRQKQPDNLELRLSWRGSGAIPQIHLFNAVEAAGGTKYLTDDGIAREQVAPAYRVAVRDKSGRYTIGTDGFSFSTAFWQNAVDKGQKFLFEAAKEGRAALVLELVQRGRVLGESRPVYCDLKNIKWMYERVSVKPTDEHFPAPYDADGSLIYPGGIFNEAPLGFTRDTIAPYEQPWDEAPQCVIGVHGWANDYLDFLSNNETMFKRLWWQGYRGRYVAFRWEALTALTSYNTSEFRAWKYGESLRKYVESLKQDLNGYTVSVIAHSMGNVLVGSALKRGMVVDNYLLMEAAIPAGCYDEGVGVNNYAPFLREEAKKPTPDLASRDKGYRGYLKGVTGNLVNFFNEDDYALATGSLIGFDVNWEGNQIRSKPDGPFQGGRYRYLAGVRPSVSSVFATTTDRTLADPHEVMSFVARPRSKALGARNNVGWREGGVIDPNNFVDLKGRFGFGSDSKDHSGQYNRRIQQVNELFVVINDSLRK